MNIPCLASVNVFFSIIMIKWNNMGLLDIVSVDVLRTQEKRMMLRRPFANPFFETLLKKFGKSSS